MSSYLERYRAGEREQVWAELVALGPAVRDEAVFPDAQAVAREMMLRVRCNIAVLIMRLQQLDYQFFLGIQHAWTIPRKQDYQMLAKLQKGRGPLPLVALTWAEMIGEVDLCGSHPRLSSSVSLDQRGHTPPVSDPLVFGITPISMTDVWPLDATRTQYALTVAPDECMKAETSGGAGSILILPNASFDAAFRSADWWNGLELIPYLRTCFAWGGFPGLRDQPEAAAAAREELAFLTKDLLPI